MTDSSNQVVVVTGAAQGIGEAIANRFAKKGASVAVVDLNEDGARQCVAGIEEDFGHQIECLLRARRDYELVGINRQVPLTQMFPERVKQGWIARGRAILEGLLPDLGRKVVPELVDQFSREQRVVGHAAGEGYD